MSESSTTRAQFDSISWRFKEKPARRKEAREYIRSHVYYTLSQKFNPNCIELFFDNLDGKMAEVLECNDGKIAKKTMDDLLLALFVSAGNTVSSQRGYRDWKCAAANDRIQPE